MDFFTLKIYKEKSYKQGVLTLPPNRKMITKTKSWYRNRAL